MHAMTLCGYISCILQNAHNYSGNFEIVKGIHQGTTGEWETEIGAITFASVREKEDVDFSAQQETDQTSPVYTDVNFTQDEQRAVISKLHGRLNDENHIQVHLAALALCALVKNAAREFDLGTLKSISDCIVGAQRRFQLDDFLQVVGVQIMSVIESLVQIPDSAKGFEYPPFQKGLPYFPDHACQVTIKLAERHVSEKCAKSLLQLVHSVDGKHQHIVLVSVIT